MLNLIVSHKHCKSCSFNPIETPTQLQSSVALVDADDDDYIARQVYAQEVGTPRGAWKKIKGN